MEDTLRYFFSAIFQGIAAILTLGAMFYMNYLDKNKARISELEKEARRLYQPGDSKLFEIILLTNIIEVMRDHYLTLHVNNESFNYHRQIVQEYETIVKRQEAIRNIIPNLLFKGLLLLILSSVGLFIVGYHEYINYMAFGMGIFTLVVTFNFIFDLRRIVFKSTDIDSLSMIKLIDLFRSYKGN